MPRPGPMLGGYFTRGGRRFRLALATAAVLGLSGCGGPFVYVTNFADDNVSQYRADASGRLAPLSPPTVTAGPGPTGMAISPDGRSVYVVNSDVSNGEGGVSQYDVGLNGALKPKSPAAVDTGFTPAEVAVSGDGKNVYVAHFGEHVLIQYSVGSGGELHPLSPAWVPASDRARGVTVSPSGRSVYIANSQGDQPGTISRYDRGTDGALTSAFDLVGTGSFPNDVEVSPDGKSVYVPSSGDRTVFQYDVGAGGELQPKHPPTVAAGATPARVAVSPDGESVYVTDFGGDSLLQYDVGPVGALRPKNPPAVTAGQSPSGIAVSADGESVYVVNSGSSSISQYDVGPRGSLQPKNPPTVPKGSGADGIAVSPLPAG